MKAWYIFAFAVVALLVLTGLWTKIGNGTLSETNTSGKLHMLPVVNTNIKSTLGISQRRP